MDVANRIAEDSNLGACQPACGEREWSGNHRLAVVKDEVPCRVRRVNSRIASSCQPRYSTVGNRDEAELKVVIEMLAEGDKRSVASRKRLRRSHPPKTLAAIRSCEQKDWSSIRGDAIE